MRIVELVVEGLLLLLERLGVLEREAKPDVEIPQSHRAEWQRKIDEAKRRKKQSLSS